MDKIRAEESKKLEPSREAAEKVLKEEQERMRRFVKGFMTSAGVKLNQSSSPQKVRKTGNVVLDRINRDVE